MPWYLLDLFQHSYLLNKIPVEVVLLLALLAQYIFLFNNSNCRKCSDDKTASSNILVATTHINWYTDLLKRHATSLLKVSEWKSDSHRESNGWKGKDYMHSSNSHVRIFDYFMLRCTDLATPGGAMTVDGEVDYALSAAVYFSACAESHKGLCHGGTMCAVMDDAVGWLGFCESGQCRPWSGYTVQVDTSLKKAITIGSYLRLDVWIERREGSRKIYISACLFNPDSGEVHAKCKGLFLKSAPQESKKVQ